MVTPEMAFTTVLFPWAKGDVLILDNVSAMHARMPCIGAATSNVLRSRAPAPDEEPIAWAEGRGAAFPQEHAGVDRGGAARDRA